MRARSAIWWVFICGLLLLGGCAANKTLRLAETLVSRGRYTEALEIYRKALSSDPDDKTLQKRVEETKQLESRRLMGMAAIRLSDRDYERAFDLYADATRYDPSNEEARKGLNSARDQWLEYAFQLEQQGKTNEALTIHERVLREFREYAPSTEAIDRIYAKRADEHCRAGATYMEKGFPGNALIEYLQAQHLRSNDKTIENEIVNALQQLQQTCVFTVNIKSRPRSRFKDSLWAIYLAGIFEKKGLPIVVMSGQSDASVQVVLQGTLDHPRTQSVRIQASIEVPDGTTTRPNPAYSKLKKEVDKAQAAAKKLEAPVHEAQTNLKALVRERLRRGSGTASEEEEQQRKQLARVSEPYETALDEYQRLSAQLARLPESFEEPAFREVMYPATRVTRSVVVKGDVTIRSKEGELLKHVPLNDRLAVTDQSNRELKATQARPEIKADPLELISPRELQIQAESKAMDKLEKELEAQFARFVADQWRRARHLAMVGDVEPAVETFLQAYLADPSQPLDEAIRYITDVKQAIGLPIKNVLESVSTTQASAQGQN